jgi:hypothetical protein
MSDDILTKEPDDPLKKNPGQFQPGQSGNPQGRPRGSRNAAIVALDKIGSDGAKEILEKAVELAKSGDSRSMEIILSRIWPIRKGRPIVIDLPNCTDPASVVQALARVTEAAATGEITTEEAAALGSLIETSRKALETQELEKRIIALEAKQNETE